MSNTFKKSTKTENKFFSKLSKDVQKWFNSYDFMPTNDVEATNFISSVAQTGCNRTINVSYNNSEKLCDIAINADNYKLAFYPSIWCTLSPEDKVYFMHCAFKDLCGEFNTGKLSIKWVDDICGSDEHGFYSIQDDTVYMGFDFAFSDEEMQGFLTYGLIAHEINHASQHNRGEKLIARGTNNAENFYEKSLAYQYNYLYNAICNNFFDAYLDDEHKEKYAKIKRTKKWKEFAENTYLGQLTEISSGNVQMKYTYNAMEEVFPKFMSNAHASVSLDVQKRRWSNPYDIEKAQKIFHNDLEYPNKIITLFGLYENLIQRAEALHDKNKDRIFAISNDHSLSREARYSKISKIDKIDMEIEDEEDSIDEKQKMCCNALVDFFMDKQKSPNFDEKLFEEIDYLIANLHSPIKKVLSENLHKTSTQEEDLSM
jgi:HPt (histidine-containing phosphotransfer) domain-containing protein